MSSYYTNCIVINILPFKNKGSGIRFYNKNIILPFKKKHSCHHLVSPTTPNKFYFNFFFQKLTVFAISGCLKLNGPPCIHDSTRSTNIGCLRNSGVINGFKNQHFIISWRIITKHVSNTPEQNYKSERNLRIMLITQANKSWLTHIWRRQCLAAFVFGSSNLQKNV